jgi:hypothetical protein
LLVQNAAFFARGAMTYSGCAGVGYESEAAFNRGFKKQFEVPPAGYRIVQRTMQVPAIEQKRATAALYPSRTHGERAAAEPRIVRWPHYQCMIEVYGR